MKRGFTVFLTGLPASGKSTTANVLLQHLTEDGRTVTLLDGDEVRRHLSSELGFSKKDRDLNIRRIGYVASEITRHGGIAICAAIAPYNNIRHEVRQMAERNGVFILVYMATPVETCEQRDPKGMYKKARAGLLQHFTGISDPYEPPADAEATIDSAAITPEQAADAIMAVLRRKGLLGRRRKTAAIE